LALSFWLGPGRVERRDLTAVWLVFGLVLGVMCRDHNKVFPEYGLVCFDLYARLRRVPVHFFYEHLSIFFIFFFIFFNNFLPTITPMGQYPNPSA